MKWNSEIIGKKDWDGDVVVETNWKTISTEHGESSCEGRKDEKEVTVSERERERERETIWNR